MTNKERYQKYIEENCKNCKHRNEDLCDIRIIVQDGVVITKCCYYESDIIIPRKKTPLNWQKW